MIHAYDERILGTAMDCLGEAYDYACNDLSLDIELFTYYFLRYGIAEAFEKGNPKYVSGMSGTELATRILMSANIQGIKLVPPSTNYNASPEYWTGWILAYHQWLTGRPFYTIFNLISASEIRNMYYPYHEASEMKFSIDLEMILKERRPESNLQYHRKQNGLTQQELANITGLNLRTIQQYEILAKDINHSSVNSVMALARALHCNIEDILEYTVS